jgi:RNA polymerase sigma-70 factor (ECF subfamily)
MVPRLRLLRPQADAPPAADASGDVELVHRLLGGDPRAAVLLWRSQSTMVRGLVVRTLGPGAEIEDLVQDAFSVFFRKLHTLKDPAAFRSFLYGITIREIRGELRRRRVRKWLQLTSTGELADYFAAGDENARHAFARLYRVLDTLDSRGHLAFVLRHFEGYELTEVAEALSCSLATVKRVLSSAETRVWSLAARDPYLAPYLEPKAAKS